MLEKELNDDLNIALEASKGAGDIIMKYYKHEYEIKEKGYHNPVTTADNEADDFLKKTLLDARPDYGWLSEETVDSKERLTKKKVWIVDPIDGTRAFVIGAPTWSNLISLSFEERSLLGLANFPELGKFYINDQKKSYCFQLYQKNFCDQKIK